MMVTFDGRQLKKLSYTDLQNMGIPEETLDKQLFGSDYEYYQNPDDGDIYEFKGNRCIGHWTETCFKVWFCED